MKPDYLVCEDILKSIEGLKEKPKLLLHSCCAPCSTKAIEYLSNYFEITIYYYNPNVYPKTEYEKRKAEQIRLIEETKKVSFLDCDYLDDEFENFIKGYELELEGGKRCEKCFILRLTKTKEIAKSLKFDYFTTTLTVSPHKNSKLINSIGKSLEEDNLKYLPCDLKKKNGYLRSIEISKQYNLYRQNYCGCKYSLNK